MKHDDNMIGARIAARGGGVGSAGLSARRVQFVQTDSAARRHVRGLWLGEDGVIIPRTSSIFLPFVPSPRRVTSPTQRLNDEEMVFLLLSSVHMTFDDASKREGFLLSSL